MSKCPLNLLVVNSLTESYVYHDILNQGITHKRRLPQSNKFDSQNSGVAVDVDFDGMKVR